MMKNFFMCSSRNSAHFLFIIYIVFSTQYLWAGETLPDICLNYPYQYTDNKINHERPSIPYDAGLLWKIEKNDTVNHLFGTMHSQDRRVTLLPPQVLLAIVQSKTIVMEVIPNQQANEIFTTSMYFSGDKSISELIDTSVYERLQDQIVHYGIKKDNIPRIKPWAAFSILAAPYPVRALTQDQVIMNQAISANKTIVGIETMDELVASLESIPLSDQVEILTDTVCNHANIVRDAEKLVLLYMDRDLGGIVNFNNQPHHDEAVFNRFINIMVNDRNLRMLDRIEPYLNTGAAFITVGASHLPGEKGLLKLLEQKGYKIELVY